jgi:hypothetical protein
LEAAGLYPPAAEKGVEAGKFAGIYVAEARMGLPTDPGIWDEDETSASFTNEVRRSSGELEMEREEEASPRRNEDPGDAVE